MMIKKFLASWSKICPGCNIARKYPNSLAGRMIRAHWRAGCPCHNAFTEIYANKAPGDHKTAYQVPQKGAS